ELIPRRRGVPDRERNCKDGHVFLGRLVRDDGNDRRCVPLRVAWLRGTKQRTTQQREPNGLGCFPTGRRGQEALAGKGGLDDGRFHVRSLSSGLVAGTFAT